MPVQRKAANPGITLPWCAPLNGWPTLQLAPTLPRVEPALEAGHGFDPGPRIARENPGTTLFARDRPGQVGNVIRPQQSVPGLFRNQIRSLLPRKRCRDGAAAPGVDLTPGTAELQGGRCEAVAVSSGDTDFHRLGGKTARGRSAEAVARGNDQRCVGGHRCVAAGCFAGEPSGWLIVVPR